MNFLSKKPVAVLIMSLVILASLILIAQVPVLEALVVCGILLAVCILVDLVAGAKALTKMQSRLAAIAIGGTAIVGIVIFGVATGSAMPDPDVASSPSPSTSQDVEPPTSTSPETTEGDEKPTDEMYELGLFYYEREEYEKAIQTLDKVKDTSDFYADAMKLRAEVADGYRSSLADTAKTYVDKGDYKLAIDILNAGLLVIPEDAELLQTIETYSLEYANLVRTAAIADAETFAAAQDYANALTAIQGAIDEVGSDAELGALADKYMFEYKEKVFTKTNELLYSEGYYVARDFLEDSINVLPNDPDLTKKIEEFRALAPVGLEQISTLTGDDWYVYDTVNDNLGHTHTNVLGSSYFDDETKVYKLGGVYTRIRGTLFIRSDAKNSAKWGTTFKISGDGSLLYSAFLSDGDEPITFDVDISGVDKLEIYYYWGAAASYTNGFAGIGECFLYQY